jgi:hypothetical protein
MIDMSILGLLAIGGGCFTFGAVMGLLIAGMCRVASRDERDTWGAT